MLPKLAKLQIHRCTATAPKTLGSCWCWRRTKFSWQVSGKKHCSTGMSWLQLHYNQIIQMLHDLKPPPPPMDSRSGHSWCEMVVVYSEGCGFIGTCRS